MLGRIALLVGGCVLAWSAAAQGLFDDNEARQRIERLRQQAEENQRALNERLKKMDAALAAAADRSALVEISTQLDAMRNEMARMRGQLEVLDRKSVV